MNTTTIFFCLAFLTTLLTFVGIVHFANKKEGFENVDDKSPLVTVMGTIRRMSTTLMDINMWKERITMANMTPIELARYYIKSNAKSEDA
jgi:hypothetical protein